MGQEAETLLWARDRLQGGMTGIGGYLSNGVETSDSGNFLESIRVTLVRTPSNRGYGHLL